MIACHPHDGYFRVMGKANKFVEALPRAKQIGQCQTTFESKSSVGDLALMLNLDLIRNL